MAYKKKSTRKTYTKAQKAVYYHKKAMSAKTAVLRKFYDKKARSFGG